MFYFQNFKGFIDASLNLERPLTILIGPNGSGKSNAIEGVELLAFLVRGRPLHEITDVGRGGSLEIRGGLQACTRAGQDAFKLAFKSELPFEGVNQEIAYEIAVQTAQEPRIAAEALRIAGRDTPVFEVVGTESDSTSADNQVRYDNFARGPNKPVASVAADRSALSQYPRFAADNRRLQTCLELVSHLARLLEAAFVFDPIPKMMRGYERMSETVLSRNGFNLSPVLYSLSRSPMGLGNDERAEKLKLLAAEKRKALERIRERIVHLPDEPFELFDFIRTRQGDVMLAFKSADGKRVVDAKVLSDGTLRSLGVLTALETAALGSRVVVEEFDNGVHPSRVHVLTQSASDCSARRKLRVLVTTHNPATLNALEAGQLKDVVFCVWDKSVEAFRMVEISDLPGYVEFLEQGRLGDLVTRRIVEQHLAPGYEEERRKQVLEWVGNLP